jgi:curved DNA-binding protein CbpA
VLHTTYDRYYQLSKKYHPDGLGASLSSSVQWLELQEAYKKLSCPLDRQSYDHSLFCSGSGGGQQVLVDYEYCERAEYPGAGYPGRQGQRPTGKRAGFTSGKYFVPLLVLALCAPVVLLSKQMKEKMR